MVALSTLACASSRAAVAENPAPSSAEAPSAPAAPIAPPSPDLPGLPSTAIELAQVPVSSDDFEVAAAAYRDTAGRHTSAQNQRHDLDRTASDLVARSRELEAIRASSQARIAGLTARLDKVERAIQELAVETFVAGGEEERLNEAVSSEAPATNEAERRDVLAGISMDVLLAERAAYQARIDAAAERADQAVTDLAKAREALELAATGRPAALDDELASATAVAEERVVYEEARVLAQVEGVEFPLVALDAYYRAATTVAEERPTCGVEWWGLAGISRVEGRHGTYGGTLLMPNGDTNKRIIGIQLNGSNSTAVVGDTDDGTLDGDASYDRAVGPMQFIPQTWRRFGADGNDDGTTSPFNLYDSTLAAATYLCTASRGLDADPGLRAAYFSYNHSVLYVDSVLGYARLYERSIDVPDRVPEATG
jgi:membrane-bound lytic murein transglycosylase B